jgi:GST-like protein
MATKVMIFLEEAEVPYRLVPVNIVKEKQFKPNFLAISPNNSMPAMIDFAPADGGAPISVFESGAILLYLAERTGHLPITPVVTEESKLLLGQTAQTVRFDARRD